MESKFYIVLWFLKCFNLRNGNLKIIFQKVLGTSLDLETSQQSQIAFC